MIFAFFLMIFAIFVFFAFFRDFRVFRFFAILQTELVFKAQLQALREIWAGFAKKQEIRTLALATRFESKT